MTARTFGGLSPIAQLATVRAAAEIRALMARYGVVQEGLQQVLGLSQTAVSKRLRGVTPWDINELAAVAEFFQMPLDQLIAAAERPHPAGPDGASAGVRRRQVELPRSYSKRQPAGYASRELSELSLAA